MEDVVSEIENSLHNIIIAGFNDVDMHDYFCPYNSRLDSINILDEWIDTWMRYDK